MDYDKDDIRFAYEAGKAELQGQERDQRDGQLKHNVINAVDTVRTALGGPSAWADQLKENLQPSSRAEAESATGDLRNSVNQMEQYRRNDPGTTYSEPYQRRLAERIDWLRQNPGRTLPPELRGSRSE